MIPRLGRGGPGFEPRNGPFLDFAQHATCFQMKQLKWVYLRRAHGVVVSRLLRMQKALGSNPSGSTRFFLRIRTQNGLLVNQQRKLVTDVCDSLAERSKAPDSSSGGAIRVGSNPTAVSFCFLLQLGILCLFYPYASA